MLLNKYCLTRTCVDSEKNISDLNKIAEKYDSYLEVVVDIDLGFGRTGVKSGEDSLNLVNFIKEKASRIKVVGLQGYEGHLTHNRDETIRKQMTEECMKTLVETKDLLNKEGNNIDYLTVGTSSTYKYSGRYPGITEIQPGTYVFSDEHLYSVAPEFKPAVTVLSTIQNQTGEKEFTIDAGQKAVPTGDGRPLVKDNPKVKFRLFTEEHAQLNAFEADFSIGQKIELIPAHVCITVNMYDFIHVIKNGEYIGKWDIVARGKNY
jgi:D-serine deaminase-like pyridoxal phosphate-dependent protein